MISSCELSSGVTIDSTRLGSLPKNWLSRPSCRPSFNNGGVTWEAVTGLTSRRANLFQWSESSGVKVVRID